ncbi:class I SAM-dependent methyltransferase [Spirulina sp. 06S082]|uniref:class I SAM-dependent methyltransferase n=1 Tax=Spirulina sp. 06S082 TaxID=3110248 RepID=UPI002B1F74C7|nr:class I SAM-dependent methyltransferase [Spirulina sp. 06S082]MEA5469558.1 class I SAM-dependent methyltransferase [Spirulina sp. 06S082]
MTARQDTLWKQLLEPIFGVFLDGEEIKRLQNSIDWEGECDRLGTPDFVYPEYYRSQNFHGVEGGYLTKSAATTYDPITKYVLPPNETWIRKEAIAAIGGQPRRILDMGCGTGSMALMLKQTFPDAEVTGLDLSPYMLAIADYKAQKAGLNLKWKHGKAEETHFPEQSFDLIAVALLFHETPATIAQAILQECFRLLTEGGQIVIVDGNQNTLRKTEWLNNIFEEPYIQDYAANSIEVALRSSGFEAIQTQEVWWIHQVTHGMKPMLMRKNVVDLQLDRQEGNLQPAF